jgi:hypothetical protein
MSDPGRLDMGTRSLDMGTPELTRHGYTFTD